MPCTFFHICVCEGCYLREIRLDTFNTWTLPWVGQSRYLIKPCDELQPGCPFSFHSCNPSSDCLGFLDILHSCCNCIKLHPDLHIQSHTEHVLSSSDRLSDLLLLKTLAVVGCYIHHIHLNRLFYRSVAYCHVDQTLMTLVTLDHFCLWFEAAVSMMITQACFCVKKDSVD